MELNVVIVYLKIDGHSIFVDIQNETCNVLYVVYIGVMRLMNVGDCALVYNMENGLFLFI